MTCLMSCFLWRPRVNAQPPAFQQSPLPVPLRRWPLPSRRAVFRCTSRVRLREGRLGSRSSSPSLLPGHRSTCQTVNDSERLPRASDGRCSFQHRCRCDKYQHDLFDKKARNRAPIMFMLGWGTCEVSMLASRSLWLFRVVVYPQ